jgi:hypothetical protein
MEDIKPIIDRLNKFFENHTFEVVTQPTHDENHPITTNVKVEITGMKEYLRIGESTQFIQYTLYILKTNEESDKWNSLFGGVYGFDVPISTRDNAYHQLRWVMDHKLEEFLRVFSIDNPAICTRVINEIEPMKLNESIEEENNLDQLTKLLVGDILRVFEKENFGEYRLPEYFNDEDMVYTQSVLNGFSLDLDVEISEDVKTFEVDGDLYYDDDSIYINILYNPNVKNEIVRNLVGELIETIRHEIEHIIQINNGLERVDEPEEPEEYYTQEKELGAQKAGFKLASKETNLDFETFVRNWFDKYKHKHSLSPEQKERVIKKILDEK